MQIAALSACRSSASCCSCPRSRLGKHIQAFRRSVWHGLTKPSKSLTAKGIEGDFFEAILCRSKLATVKWTTHVHRNLSPTRNMINDKEIPSICFILHQILFSLVVSLKLYNSDLAHRPWRSLDLHWTSITGAGTTRVQANVLWANRRSRPQFAHGLIWIWAVGLLKSLSING